MKLKGRTFNAPQDEVVVFPRQSTYEEVNGEKTEINNDIPFRCRMVTEIGDYEKIFPAPKPREVVKPGGVRFLDVENQEYKKAIAKWTDQRMDWLILKSLDATPGLEWETVDMQDPETWGNFRNELLAGLNRVELTLLTTKALIINSIDSARMEEAKQRFLQSEMGMARESSSQAAELQNTPSGQPAKDSV